MHQSREDAHGRESRPGFGVSFGMRWTNYEKYAWRKDALKATEQGVARLVRPIVSDDGRSTAGHALLMKLDEEAAKRRKLIPDRFFFDVHVMSRISKSRSVCWWIAL